MSLGHVPSEFPKECVSELVEAIKGGDFLQAVPCGLVVLAWLWGQIFRPPLGNDEQAANEAVDIFAGLLKLNTALGGGFAEAEAKELSEPLSDAIMKRLLLQTMAMLLEWFNERGGFEWLIGWIDEQLKGPKDA